MRFLPILDMVELGSKAAGAMGELSSGGSLVGVAPLVEAVPASGLGCRASRVGL